MLRCAATVWSRQARPVSFASAVRSIATVTADDALKYSGYMQIDFTIPEDTPVYDAVQKFAAFNIGCLVTTDKAGTYSYSSRLTESTWR
jgi:predicted transcriptional regulator